MNQIWELLAKVLRQGINPVDLYYFAQNNRVSPYIELSSDSIYEECLSEKLISHVDVNPYYRFSDIFDKFITPDNLGYNEFNEGIADVLLHYLANIDLKLGMNIREFYIKFIIENLEDGVFGSEGIVNKLTAREKRVIADGILTLYATSDYINCLTIVMKKIIPDCQLFVRDEEEIVFYIREPENSEIYSTVQLIIKLFLPIYLKVVIHWTCTYGIIGYDKKMVLDEFVI